MEKGLEDRVEKNSIARGMRRLLVLDAVLIKIISTN